MALILTGKKVNNAASYTITFTEVEGDSAEEPVSVSVESTSLPEGEMFYYNLTNVSSLKEGVKYKVECQACAASNDPCWTDSLVQNVDSRIIKPSTASE
jgi:hypothetical protein